ncbi:MAG: protein kinase [Akkermansia sp.]|nr:protein kinase [Akkermansia sp.]
MNTISSTVTVINSSELPKGYVLSNYVIERKLGHGGFGITYLARETATNRAVVIKENFPRECSQRHTTNLMVGPSSAEDKGLYEWALTRFLDEAKVLIRLSHPGIVPVLTAFKALGTAYYVMPQVEGREIHKAAPSPQTINEAWLRPVLQKLLEALDYLHGEGLLHRDIKPSNILMRADTSPLLIDFGTARSSDATHTLTRMGTPGFSPSEQFLARGKNGPWTDLYSLGATCYYLITGEVPQDSMERLAEDELLPLASRKELQGRFSAEFLSAIDKALRSSHKNRWQSAQEWMNHLSAAERRRKEEAKQQAVRKASEAHAQSARALAEQRAREEAEEKVRRMMEERRERERRTMEERKARERAEPRARGEYFVLPWVIIGIIIGGISGSMWMGIFGVIFGGFVGAMYVGILGFLIWNIVANKRHILIILPVIGAVIGANIGADNGGFEVAALAAAIGGVIGAFLGCMISQSGKS